MATVKITITLKDKQLDEIRRRVTKHESASVSGFVQHAVQRALENCAEFSAMIEEGLVATGGPLTAEERAWARKVVTPKRRRSRKGTPSNTCLAEALP